LKEKLDINKPDDTSRKLLDVMRLHNWKHKTSLEEGIRKMHKWYTEGFEP